MKSLTVKDLESLIFLTSGCLDNTERISAYVLERWGLGAGDAGADGSTVDSPEDMPAGYNRWDEHNRYPLTARQSQFVAEDCARPQEDRSQVDLVLAYSGLVLTPTGPVKVLVPSWEHSYGNDLPGRDEAQALLQGYIPYLNNAVGPLGGVATIWEDIETGGEYAAHELVVAVPIDSVTREFADLAHWKHFLTGALRGGDRTPIGA